MKARTKSAIAKDRRERTKTGGGPAETELDAVSIAISTMLTQQIKSIGNEFDDDAALHGDLEKNPIIDEMATCISDSTDTPREFTSSTRTSSIAKKRLPGKQGQVKTRLLEIVEEKHAAKMRTYKLKEEVITLKKRKLEESFSINNEESLSIPPTVHKDTCSAWRPF